MAAIDPSYEGIIDIVATWPAHRRFSLVQAVLKTLETEIPQEKNRSDTLSKALGLLAVDQSAPTDREVDEWLKEHRIEKYG